MDFFESPSIAITGMGTVSAGGRNVEELWQSALQGRVKVEQYQLKKSDVVLPVYRAELPELSKKDQHLVRQADRTAQLLLAAAREAWEAAQLTGSTYASDRIGIIIGSSRGPMMLQEEHMRSLKKKPSAAIYSTGSSIAGILAAAFSIEGPAFVVASTCTSGATALAMGQQLLQSGVLDLVLVGGVDAPLTESLLEQYYAAGVLARIFHASQSAAWPKPMNTALSLNLDQSGMYSYSPDPNSASALSHQLFPSLRCENHEISELAESQNPSLALRPFDRDRAGTALGEGAAVVILESEKLAAQRKAPIIGKLDAVALQSHPGCRASLDPNGKALQQVLKKSLEQSKLSINNIGSLHLHGTGTKQNDLIESHVINVVFGTTTQQPLAWANKAITGHVLGASPLFQLILALQTVRHGWVPSITHCDHLDPACNLRISRGEALAGAPALCLNSGFWGNVSSIVISPKNWLE